MSPDRALSQKAWGPKRPPRHEAGQGEVGQVHHDYLGLLTAKVRDRRADHQQHQPDGSERHQNRREIERGRQDQAHRGQDLEDSDGLDAAGPEVFDPSPPGAAANFSLGRISLMTPPARKATASNTAMIHRAVFTGVLSLQGVSDGG